MQQITNKGALIVINQNEKNPSVVPAVQQIKINENLLQSFQKFKPLIKSKKITSERHQITNDKQINILKDTLISTNQMFAKLSGDQIQEDTDLIVNEQIIKLLSVLNAQKYSFSFLQWDTVQDLVFQTIQFILKDSWLVTGNTASNIQNSSQDQPINQIQNSHFKNQIIDNIHEVLISISKFQIYEKPDAQQCSEKLVVQQRLLEVIKEKIKNENISCQNSKILPFFLVMILKLLKKSEKFKMYAKDQDLLLFMFNLMPTIINSLLSNYDLQSLSNVKFLAQYYQQFDNFQNNRSQSQKNINKIDPNSQGLNDGSQENLKNQKDIEDKAERQRRVFSKQNFGFNLNLQDVLGSQKFIKGGINGPMSGPIRGLGGIVISGKSNGNQTNLYANLETSGIRNQFYRNGGVTYTGGGIPPMSTSQSRRFTQMTQQDAVSMGPIGYHNKSLDGYRQRPQDSSQSPQRIINNQHVNSDSNENDQKAFGQLIQGQNQNFFSGQIIQQKMSGAFVMSQQQELAQRQNLHRFTQMNKISFVRAASEPPQIANSLNSKSIIPVYEENENHQGDETPVTIEKLNQHYQNIKENINEQTKQNLLNDKIFKDHGDLLNQNITKNDLFNQQRQQKFNKKQKNSSELNVEKQKYQEYDIDGQKKRNSSSYVMNSIIGVNNRQKDINQYAQSHLNQANSKLVGQIQHQNNQNQISALSSKISQQSNEKQMQMIKIVNGQMINREQNNSATPAVQYKSIQNQNQQIALNHASRRQRSFGQQTNQGKQNNKLQTASNQVIAAYGDPRDQRFNIQASNQMVQGIVGTPNNGQENHQHNDYIKNQTISDQNSFDNQQIGSRDFQRTQDLLMSERLDSMCETENQVYGESRSPFIPKLNLIQINQDNKQTRQRLESSIGPHKIMGNAGATSLLATPGQHQNINSVAFVKGAPPLTSHYPIITSCSPDKRGDQIIYCLDTSNRTSALIPIQIAAAGKQRILTSFTNAIGSNPHLISTESVNDKRFDNFFAQKSKGTASQRGANTTNTRQVKVIGNQSKGVKQIQSFKRQRNNMIMKLKQFHTQHTHNNSELNRVANSKEQEIFDPQTNALISEANAANISGGRITTNNNRSNSLKLLDGMALSTLNPFGGTQASNFIGMNNDAGKAINIGTNQFDMQGSALIVQNPEFNIQRKQASAIINDLGTQLGQSFLAQDMAFITSFQKDMELQNEAEQAVLNQDKQDDFNLFNMKQSNLQGTRCKSMIVKKEIHFDNQKQVNGDEKQLIHISNEQKQKYSHVFLSWILILNIIDDQFDYESNFKLKSYDLTKPMHILVQFMQTDFFQVQYQEQRMQNQSQLVNAISIQFNKNCSNKESQNLQNAEFNFNTLRNSLNFEKQKRIQSEIKFKIEIKYDEGLCGVQKSENFIQKDKFFELDSQECSLTKIIQKFAFINEDIMRNYVHSQFKNFIDQQKPGAIPKVRKQSQSKVNSSEVFINSKNQVSLNNDVDNIEYFKMNQQQMNKNESNLQQKEQNHQILEDNPNYILSNNGIIYDIQSNMAVPLGSSGTCIPKEVIRRKLDVSLYILSKQIKNLLVKQAQEALIQGAIPVPSSIGRIRMLPDFKWTKQPFIQNLSRLLSSLNCYLKGQSKQSSRVLLSQIIDVVLEPLLMIKKLLIDLTLIQNVYEFDQSKNILQIIQQQLLQRGFVVDDNLFIQEEQVQKNFNQQDHSSNGLNFELQNQIQLAINQIILKSVFVDYMCILQQIFKLPQTCDSLKLLNETFVANISWQNTVDLFSKSLCSSDLISSTVVSFHLNQGFQLNIDLQCIINENLENLRGINCINFEQTNMSKQIQFITNEASQMHGQNIKLNLIFEAEMQMQFLIFENILKYYSSIVKFCQQAINIYFPNIQQHKLQNQKQKQENNDQDGQNQGSGTDQIQFSAFLNRANNVANPSRGTIYANQNMNRGFSGLHAQTSRNIYQMDNSFYSGIGASGINQVGATPVNFQGRQYFDNKNNQNQSPSDIYNPNYIGNTIPQIQDQTQQEFQGNIFAMKVLSDEQKYWKQSTRNTLNQLKFWFIKEEDNQEEINKNGILNIYFQKNSCKHKCYKSQNINGHETLIGQFNFKSTCKAILLMKEIFKLNEKFTKQIPIETVLVYFIRMHHISFIQLYNQNRQYLIQIQKFVPQFRNDQNPLSYVNQIKSEKNQNKFMKLLLNHKNSLTLCKNHLKCLYAIAQTRSEDTRHKLHHFQLFQFIAQEFCLEYEYLAKRQKYLNISKKFAKEANQVDHFEIDEVYSPSVTSKRRQENNFQIGIIKDNEEVQTYQKETGNILDAQNANELRIPNSSINQQIQQKIQDSRKIKTSKFNNDMGQLQNQNEKLNFNENFDEQQKYINSQSYNQDNNNENQNEKNNEAQNEKIQQLQDQVQYSDSDSDDGLPPQIPISQLFNQNMQIKKLFIPNLQVKGLGLSTLSNNPNGLTAEQISDQELLKNQSKIKNQIQENQQQQKKEPQKKQYILNQPKELHDIKSETEIETYSNILESMNSNVHISQKSLENSLKGFQDNNSDSDLGLPPPIPTQMQKFNLKLSMPKLAVTGLGLSTLSNAQNGKTQEQIADMQLLEEQKGNKKVELQSSDDSDSDQGLPPQLPFKKQLPFGLPKLAVGGLGLSTLSQNNNGKTAEQQADEQLLKENFLNKNQVKTKNSQSSSQSSSDSDQGLPPPVPIKKTLFSLPKLAVNGLGLSTLAKTEGGKTAEQIADMNILNNQKQRQITEDSNDSQSSDEHQLIQHQQSKKSLIVEQFPSQIEENNQNSQSDSDDGLPPPLPIQKAKFPFKFSLKVQGLGLSTIKQEGQTMTQEEQADAQHLKDQQNAQKNKAISQQIDESEDEDLSSDEQYYRELEKIKKDGQQDDESQNMMEGGSKRDEEEEQKNGAINKKQIKFNTIDRQVPEMIFQHQLHSTNLNSAKINMQHPLNLKNTQIKQSNQLKSDEQSSWRQKVENIINSCQSSTQQIKVQNHENQGNFEIPSKLKLAEYKNKQIEQEQKTILNKSNIKIENSSGQKLNIQKRKSIQNNQDNSTQIQDSQNVINKIKQTGINQKEINLQTSNQSSQQTLKLKLIQNINFQKHQNAQNIDLKDQNQLQSQQSSQRANIKQINQNIHKDKEIFKSQIIQKKNVNFYKNEEKSESSNFISNIQDYDIIDQEFLKCEEEKQQKDINKINILNIQSERFENNWDIKQNELKMNLQNENISIINSNNNSKKHLMNIDQIDLFNNQQKLLSDKSNNKNLLELSDRKKPVMQKTKSMKIKKKKAVRINRDDFYMMERGKKPIYLDQELHSLMISLAFCLLLQPQRGTLDDLYCHQYPINNYKENYLYILHQHLSHDSNQYIIKDLIQEMNNIQPPLSGQRLLRLMCPSLFDLKLYNSGKDWKKLAEGAYGTVYECKTNLIQPKSVAIKQLNLPSDIYDRCVLHDIFTEITCLEEFRIEKCVTDLYDYGVDKNCYYIVMKKYQSSLGEWRRKQGNSIQVLQKNMKLYFSIYNKVLKCLRTIHSHNVTHYDLKCDNVLISFNQNNEHYDQSSRGNLDQYDSNSNVNRDLSNLTEDDFEITIGDFGECKIFSDEKDELCTRNRGTDSIKSPEMLQLAINTRKDHDKYDRRKQVGTNRLSDIWSIGCLFYELCTGEFMLYHPDFAYFFVRVVSHQQELITNENIQKIDNSQYIKDFLKFILIRDQRYRPTIDKVIKRFDLIHAIVCNLGEPQSEIERSLSDSFNNGAFSQLHPSMLIKNNQELQACLSQVAFITKNDSKLIGSQNIHEKQYVFTKIIDSIYLCSSSYLQKQENIKNVLKIGITHLIISTQMLSNKLKDKFEIFEFNQVENEKENKPSLILGDSTNQQLNPFKLAPLIMDFLRKVTLYKGRLLFVDDNNQLVRECLLVTLNHIFKSNSFETYTLIKSQSLFFQIEAERLSVLSEWNMLAFKIRQYLTAFPQFSCHCRASLIILDKSFAQYQNIQNIVACSCPQKVNILNPNSIINASDQMLQSQIGTPSGRENHYQKCPCSSNLYVSCKEYLDFLEIYYNNSRGVKSTHINQNPFNSNQNQLIWGYFDAQDLMLGPNPIFQQDKQNFNFQYDQQSLDSLKSHASSQKILIQNNGKSIIKIPQIAIGQVLQPKKKSSGVNQLATGQNHASEQINQQFILHTPSEKQKKQQIQILNQYERQIASNLSMTIDLNTISVVSDQKMINFQNQLNTMKQMQNFQINNQTMSPNYDFPSPNSSSLLNPQNIQNLRNGKGLSSQISQLSNTPDQSSDRRQAINAQRKLQSFIDQSQLNNSKDLKNTLNMKIYKNEWDIKKCSTCHCWTHAYHPGIKKFAVLLNNRVLFNQDANKKEKQQSIPNTIQSLKQNQMGHYGRGVNNNLDKLEKQFVLVKNEYLKYVKIIEEQQQMELQQQQSYSMHLQSAEPRKNGIIGLTQRPILINNSGINMSEHISGRMNHLYSNQNYMNMNNQQADKGVESINYGINESMLLQSVCQRVSTNR